MAVKTIKASYLVDKFKLMLDQKWKYVANAAREGEVDCSGAFTYWYEQAGSYMIHGSNSMIRNYSVKWGKIGEIELKPGMAVFRWRNDGGEPEKFKADGLGNFRHVGLYIGNGKTIDARDSKTSVAIGNIKDWDYAAELKYTEYDLRDGDDEIISDIGEDDLPPYVEPKKQFSPCEGRVATSGGTLNLRKKPVNGTIMKRIPFDTILQLTEEDNGWYKTTYSGVKGWVSGDFIEIVVPSFDRSVTSFVHDESTYIRLISWLDGNNIEYFVTGGDD